MEEELSYAEKFERDLIEESLNPIKEVDGMGYEMSDEEIQAWMDEMNASAEASHEADRLEEERLRACL